MTQNFPRLVESSERLSSLFVPMNGEPDSLPGPHQGSPFAQNLGRAVVQRGCFGFEKRLQAFNVEFPSLEVIQGRLDRFKVNAGIRHTPIMRNVGTKPERLRKGGGRPLRFCRY